MNEDKKVMKTKKKKSLPVILVIILVVVLAGAGMVKKISDSMKQVKEQMEAMAGGDNDGTYKVERQSVEQEIVSSGTVVGIDKKAYTSPVTAKVDKICVQVGQTVKSGDVLLTYDTSDLGDNLEKVRLQAQADAATGQASYESVNDAQKKAAEADKKADKIKKEIKTAKSDVSSAKSDVSSIKSEIETIKSEIETLKKEVSAASKKLTAEQNKLDDDMEAGKEKIDKTALRKAQDDLTDKQEKLANKQEELAGKQEKLAEKQTTLSEKQGKLTEKQGKLSEQQAISSSNKEVKVSESTKTQMAVSSQLNNMNINNAQESLDAAEAGIRAATDGIIESIETIEGAYASETQTLLTLIDSNKIGVEFSVAKDDLSSITPGQKARVEISGKQYDGTVDFISRVAVNDAAFASSGAGTAGIKGRIILDAPDEDIFIGVTAKVYVFVGKSDNALAVPYEALNTDVDGDFVYIVNDEGLIERKDVVVGIYSDEYYEITEGISEGDKVIKNVTKDMKPGDTYVPPVSVPTGMGLMG